MATCRRHGDVVPGSRRDARHGTRPVGAGVEAELVSMTDILVKAPALGHLDAETTCQRQLPPCAALASACGLRATGAAASGDEGASRRGRRSRSAISGPSFGIGSCRRSWPGPGDGIDVLAIAIERNRPGVLDDATVALWRSCAQGPARRATATSSSWRRWRRARPRATCRARWTTKPLCRSAAARSGRRSARSAPLADSLHQVSGT